MLLMYKRSFGDCSYNSREIFRTLLLRQKCPYSELFWSAFSRIRTEYGEILRIAPVFSQNERKC